MTCTPIVQEGRKIAAPANARYWTGADKPGDTIWFWSCPDCGDAMIGTADNEQEARADAWRHGRVRNG